MSEKSDWSMHGHRRARRPSGDQRLVRSRQRLLGGVAAGAAALIGANPLFVRLLWLVSLPLSGGITGIAYLLLWSILPLEGRSGGSG